MQIHGILNVVSWGILFPIGVITARYLKNFEFGDPAWFYLHIFFQLSAYIIGVAGWGTGLKLGGESKGIVYHTHRNIGIALFCIATVQVKINYTIFYLPKMCVSCKFISFSPIISKFRNHIWMKVTEAVRVFFFFLLHLLDILKVGNFIYVCIYSLARVKSKLTKWKNLVFEIMLLSYLNSVSVSLELPKIVCW